MEFLVVSKTKLKAILDAEDMKKYKLDPGEEYSGAGARRVFREILAAANEEVGFRTGNDKVLIQLYPSRDGGGELFVTKLGALAKGDAKIIAESKNVIMLTNTRRLYKFEDLEAIVMCSKSITAREVKSDVYYLNGAYFLATEEEALKSGYELAKLSEFGERLPEKLIPYIAEQGRLIFADSAIEAFSRL